MLVTMSSMKPITVTADTSRADHRQNQVAHRLAQAMSQGKLQLVYQPEVSLISREMTSLEVLCRWDDSELGQVAPDEFIAVAEARGLIAPLGEYMLRAVLADLPLIADRWPQAKVAINVSGLELALPDFAQGFVATLGQTGMGLASHLELEVTESVFHHNIPVVNANLNALRALGITVAIDDFGTGQSSLARLHTLPFDKIKLDRSFTKALQAPMVQAIVKAMVQLTNTFSQTLVVEGVESQEQLQLLIDLGCHVGQGYLFCRPSALADLPMEIVWPMP
jgi:EAL domain-containing protein (putative c-di-GMP-specific phosphodiesterase class I)